MSVEIERVSVSLGAKLTLPRRQYENYDAHIMIQARMMPGKSQKERNEDWMTLRKKAQAQLKEALSDAKHVAMAAHGKMDAKRRAAHGIKPSLRRTGTTQKEEILKYYDSGLSPREVAAAIGGNMEPHYVSQVFRRHEDTFRRQEDTEPTPDERPLIGSYEASAIDSGGESGDHWKDVRKLVNEGDESDLDRYAGVIGFSMNENEEKKKGGKK
jgi:hypothetical protein